MKTLPQISEAEFEVMKIIWKHAPISTNEITEKLTQTTKWSPKTIQTLIKRLVTKGALSYEKQSRTCKRTGCERLVCRLYRNRWQHILFCHQHTIHRKCHRKQGIRNHPCCLIRYGDMGTIKNHPSVYFFPFFLCQPPGVPPNTIIFFR